MAEEVEDRLATVQQSVGQENGITLRVDIPDLVAAEDERGKRIVELRQGQWWDGFRREPADLKSSRIGFGSIEGIGWFGVDLFVTFRLSKVTNVGRDDGSAYDIVRRLLEPLEQWVR